MKKRVRLTKPILRAIRATLGQAEAGMQEGAELEQLEDEITRAIEWVDQELEDRERSKGGAS